MAIPSDTDGAESVLIINYDCIITIVFSQGLFLWSFFMHCLFTLSFLHGFFLLILRPVKVMKGLPEKTMRKVLAKRQTMRKAGFSSQIAPCKKTDHEKRPCKKTE